MEKATQNPHHPENGLLPELWNRIIYYIPHQDILSLTSTGHTLYELQGLKATWVAILLSICDKRGLYIPSFPFDEMEIGQIRRVAKGWTYHWPNLVKEFGYQYPGFYSSDQSGDENISETDVEISQAPKSLNPISTQDLGVLLPDLEDTKKFLLVPGGRYLLTVDSQHLRCVDLGPVGVSEFGDRGRATSIVVQIDLIEPDASSGPDEFRFICDLIADSLDDGETLRVAIASNIIAKVYDIVLKKWETPSFKQLGVIRFHNDYGSKWKWKLSFLGDRLFLRAEKRVLAWNFIAKRYTWGPATETWVSQSMCTEHFYIGFNDEAILTWYVPSWDATAVPIPSLPLPFDLDDTSVMPPQPRINRRLDWSISLDFDELQRDGETRFVLPSRSSDNTKLPISLDMFFVSGPWAFETELPTIAYRYSLDVVLRDDIYAASFPPERHSDDSSNMVIKEVKYEMKGYWKFPSKRFEFFPRDDPGPYPASLEFGYSSTALAWNYLNDVTIPRESRSRDVIYSLIKAPPISQEEEDELDRGNVGMSSNALERRRRRRRRDWEVYPDLVLTKLHDNQSIQSISICKSACRSVYTTSENGRVKMYVAEYLA